MLLSLHEVASTEVVLEALTKARKHLLHFT